MGVLLSLAGIAVLVALAATARTSNGLWTFESPAMGALIFIGVAQILWVGPASIVLLIMKRTRTLLGMLIVAGVVFLANSAWFGFAVLHR